MSPRGCDGEREALSLRAAAERPLLRIVCVRSLHTGFNLDRTALMTMRCCMRGPGEGLNVWALFCSLHGDVCLSPSPGR